MNKKEVTLKMMYDSFQHTIILFYNRTDSVEDFLLEFPTLRFHNHRFILSNNKDISKGRKFYLGCFYVKKETKWISVAHSIKDYIKLFPFIEFIKDVDGLWCSDWMDTNKLLEILPSRENIIKELLAEL